MRFEWDPSKNASNKRKHGVGFEEAARVFDAPDRALELFDELHSFDEDRFITIGPIASGLVLVVWCEVVDDVIRIISARFATKRETGLYRRAMQERT